MRTLGEQEEDEQVTLAGGGNRVKEEIEHVVKAELRKHNTCHIAFRIQVLNWRTEGARR